VLKAKLRESAEDSEVDYEAKRRAKFYCRDWAGAALIHMGTLRRSRLGGLNTGFSVGQVSYTGGAQDKLGEDKLHLERTSKWGPPGTKSPRKGQDEPYTLGSSDWHRVACKFLGSVRPAIDKTVTENEETASTKLENNSARKQG
jgi:hypothetical protein